MNRTMYRIFIICAAFVIICSACNDKDTNSNDEGGEGGKDTGTDTGTGTGTDTGIGTDTGTGTCSDTGTGQSIDDKDTEDHAPGSGLAESILQSNTSFTDPFLFDSMNGVSLTESCLKNPNLGAPNISQGSHSTKKAVDLVCSPGEVLVNPFPTIASVVSLTTMYSSTNDYENVGAYNAVCSSGAIPSPTADSACNNEIYLKATINGETWVLAMFHIQSASVIMNQLVAPFEAVATCGAVGWATGPHVHMTLYNETTKTYHYPGTFVAQNCSVLENPGTCQAGFTCCDTDGSYILAGETSSGCNETAQMCSGGGACLSSLPSNCLSGSGLYCGSTVGLTPETLYHCENGNYTEVAPCDSGCHVSAPGQSDYCEINLKARTDAIKAAAVSVGISNAVILAGIGYGESYGLKHCWYEVPENLCRGPVPSDYGFADCHGQPVMAGSGDGPCEILQGGLGAFQLDGGTHNQTLLRDGEEILSLSGNIAAGIAHVIATLIVKGHAANEAEAVAYINKAVPSTTAYDTWRSVLPCVYNGCCHGGNTCIKRGNNYHDSTMTLLNAFGADYWNLNSTGNCPDGNRIYCGSELGLDANTRFNCIDGNYSVVEVCANGCIINGNTTHCAPHNGCPPKARFCGVENLNPDVLYWCESGTFHVAETCIGGCQQTAGTQSDMCNAPPVCPSGDGLYCGDTSNGQNPNTLYQCTAGTYSVSQSCANGCVVAAPGTNDYCAAAPVTCPSGNGLYCGDAGSGQNPNTLYQCTNGTYSVSQGCSNGCVVAAPGTNDYCAAAPVTCPSGNGLYCGNAGSGQNPNTLYQCTNGTYSVSQACSNGCVVAAPGFNDYCQ